MENNTFSGKRLLILGGNPETGSLVNYANELGIHTIVIDPNPLAPAKKYAAESYDIDVMDLNQLEKFAKNLNLDGILVGVADILVSSYYFICEKLGFPCYATLDAIDTFTSKNSFRDKCEENKIGVIPYYKVNENLSIDDLKNLEFPVLVKPVDNGAGVGMNISKNIEELKDHIQIALNNSKRKEFIVERYMNCEDMLVYYTISDGIPHLSAAADRYTTKIQNIGSPVCALAFYPSKHIDLYIKDVHEKVVNLIKRTGVKNGVLNIQFFVDEKGFYAYDPGFRLQGEAPHLYLNEINNFDNRRMLISYALTSSTNEPEIIYKNDPYFKGKVGSTLWILLREGQISEIEGLSEIKQIDGLFQYVQRLGIGDIVTKEMIGTERQVFGRFYILSNSTKELKDKIVLLQNKLKIYDSKGSNMILEQFDIEKISL